MNFFNVTAIVRSTRLKEVEQRLQEANVRGITVTKAKGYGEYKNFFAPDWMITHARIEILTSRAAEIADVIVEAAHTGHTGDGVVAIIPTEKVIHIREQRELGAGEE